jgi:hypothetical protein
MFKTSAILLSLLAAASASAQVELRIIEREGRTGVSSPSDPPLNFAVQGRIAGSGIAAFGFNIHFLGEPEAYGTLTRGLISNLDHTYSTALAANNSVGRGGLAYQFGYLAQISASFNGVINTSSGSFTNTPDQEIGLVTGAAIGSALLGTPGVDTDDDGNPDTWPGSGTTATLPPSVSSTYFGGAAHWVDLYRFRYTPTDFRPRTIRIRLQSLQGTAIQSLMFAGGVWGTAGADVGAIASDLEVSVNVDGGLAACCNPHTGVCTTTTGALCVGYLFPGACTPGSCASLGPCCTSSGACELTTQTDCAFTWTTGSTCDPNPCPQPGVCCSSAGVCSLRLQSVCVGDWSADGGCAPNLCPQPGTCCAASGACTVTLQASCQGGWSTTASCSSIVCSQPNACCSSAGACTLVLPAECTGTFLSASSCTPDPCDPPGSCCSSLGDCAILTHLACGVGLWRMSGACSPGICATLGACCQGSACLAATAAECDGPPAGVYHGVGSTCGPLRNLVTCCPVNFDGMNGLAPSDLFAFLGAWFANDARADFTHDGAISVQDIYQYITDWFVGCS